MDEAEKSEKISVFTCKGDGVTVTAETKLENGIPESAVLHADKLMEGSEEYTEAMEKAREELGLSKGDLLYYVPYDIYFTDGEEKIEPKSGTVKMKMEYEKDPFENIGSDESETMSFGDAEKTILHILKNEKLEKINTKILSKTDFEFEVNQFSVMGPGIALIGSLPGPQNYSGQIEIYLDVDTDDPTIKNADFTFTINVGAYTYHDSFGEAYAAYLGTATVTSIGSVQYEGANTITFQDANFGQAKITLKPGQAVRISNLPLSYYYNNGSFDSVGRYAIQIKESSPSYPTFVLSEFIREANVNEHYLYYLDDYSQTGSHIGSPSYISGGKAKYHYYNKNRSSLQLSKIVKGSTDPEDTHKAWTFNITLSDSTFNKTCGVESKGNVALQSLAPVAFTSGKGTVKLQHDQAILIKNLPACFYSVLEQEANQDGFTTTSTGESGILSDNSTKLATFTNTKEDTSSLKLTKQVTGTGGDQNKEWNFTIKLSGAKASTFNKSCNVTSTGTPTYSDTTINFTSGMANVKLKGGQSITIQGLPADHQYTVTETEADKDWYTTTKTGDTGTIPKSGTAEATFTNNKDTGNLKISKTVTGSSGDLEKNWTFDIVLSGDKVEEFDQECQVESNGTVTYPNNKITFSDGRAQVQLKSGQSITIKGIPASFTYKVTEQEANKDGYTTSNTGESGSISKDSTPEATFTNNKVLSATLPSTGGPGTKSLILLSIFLLALGLTTAKVLTSNKKNH